MKTLLACCLLLSLPSFGQTDMGNLKLNTPVSASLQGGSEHQYTLYLGRDRFVYFEVMQQGVDVVIHVQAPDGEMVGRFDSPNGTRGIEKVLFTTKKHGAYTIYIDPIRAQSPKGKYTIDLKKSEAEGETIEAFTDQLLFDYDKNGPGVSIAVVENGQVAFSKGYGLANMEYDIANTSETIFHVASISKQFTAFAILLLQEQGKLSIDDDIRKHIPEMRDFGDTITLRHLANHTSGLRDQWNLLSIAGWRTDDLITQDDILQVLYQQRELNFKPGDKMLYSNSGYTLLAEVVERVSGMSFAQFTKTYIFDPIGMRSSLFYDDHERIVKNRAYSYQADPFYGDYKKAILNYANVGATSLFTTAVDLGLWALNFEDPVVGSKETFDLMHTTATLNNGEETGYAMGQAITKLKGIPNYAHGGSDAGFRTFISRFPDRNFSVIVLGNHAECNPRSVADAIANWYFKDEKTPVTKEKGAFILSQNEFDAFVGRYEIASGMYVDIFSEFGQFYGQATGQGQVKMIATSDHTFDMPSINAQAKFVKDNSGDYSKVVLTIDGEVAIAEKLPAFDPEAVSPDDYLGTFYSDELSVYYDVAMVNGLMVLSHRKIGQYALTPLRPDQFSGNHWLFTKVCFMRNTENEIDGFTISNGRVQNLKFTKVVPQ